MDLAGVSYVDSAGLGELIQTHSTVKDHGGLLKLSNPTGRLRDVLVLARLHTILQVYESEALALESFAALQ